MEAYPIRPSVPIGGAFPLKRRKAPRHYHNRWRTQLVCRAGSGSQNSAHADCPTKATSFHVVDSFFRIAVQNLVPVLKALAC